MKPPSSNNNLSTLTLLAGMQCAAGKKAVELEVIGRNEMNPVDYVVDIPKPTDILKLRCREDTKSRAILIRSIAYENLQKTLLKPSQEIKMIIQEQMAAKNTKVSAASISIELQKNPDTSFGLHNTAKIRAEARAVQAAKEMKKILDVKKAKEKEMKAGELTLKRYFFRCGLGGRRCSSFRTHIFNSFWYDTRTLTG